MNWPDLFNAGFEFVGGCLCWANMRRLYRDKETKGVYWPATAFFAAWGFYNLYFYPQLGQWASFIGGCVLVLGNTAWVALAVYYVWRNR